MTRPGLAFLTLALLPALALGQTYRPDAIPDGGQIVHRTPHGAPVASFTFRGIEGGLWLVEYRRADRLDGPPDETHFYDAAGNMVKRRFESGAVMTYRPHNCVRTLGECRYRMIYPSGATRDYQRVTTRLEDGTIRSRLYALGDTDGPVLKDEQYLAFSEDGLVRRMERRDEAGVITWSANATRLWVEGGR